MPEAKRIAIVGGGITGLVAAHAALKRAREVDRRVAVTVVERSERFGGNLVTERVDGFLLDGGPDSWVASKPQATALVRELGLERAILGTNEATRRYYVFWADALHAVPEGLVLGVPTRLWPLALTPLFSWRGKARMAMEPFVRVRRFAPDEDESIADFATRRLGREASERLVAPLLGGISAGDASALSVRAAFPQLVAMERDRGSLVRGMRLARKATAARREADGSAFLSLEGGMDSLVQALVTRLRAEGATLRRGVAVQSLSRVPRGGWTVDLAGGERLEADAVLLAVPAHAAVRLAGALDDDLARSLRSIRYGSTAAVFLAYRRADVAHPLDGVGFVVPRALGRPILAGTWVSSKWRARAPQDHVLVRAFLGGEKGEALVARGDEELAQLARDELRALMGLDGAPLFTRIFRFVGASAQMAVGHLSTMRDVRERLARAAPGLRVAGGGYDGIGIPDCVRQGTVAGCAMVEG